MSKGKVLITGASGFLGKHIVRRLYDEGYEVLAMVRKSSNVDGIEGKAKFVYGDLERIEELKGEVRDIDYIIHSAAVVKALSSQDYYKYNFEPTVDLAQLALDLPNLKRFVFISSQAAGRPSRMPISEEIKSTPVTSYGKSKLKAEQYLSKIDELPWTVLRPAAVYGPGDKEFIQSGRSIEEES